MSNQKPKTAASKAPTPYFYITGDDEAQTADLYIFGDIASEGGGLSGLLAPSSDVSAYSVVKELNRVPEGYDITVHINSNGGEIKEGLGIYNALKERGNVTTICDGFAASAGSIIFAAGTRRIMNPASLLFIHQASVNAGGNADDFEKLAGDLRTITDAAVNAYIESGVTIDREELNSLLKAETWISPEDAVRMGFATEIADVEPEDSEGVVMNDAMRSIMAAVTAPKKTPGIEIGVDMTEVNKFLDELKAESDKFGHVMKLVTKAETLLTEHPDVFAKAETFLDHFAATTPEPTPARGGNKGFFNFKKAGETGKEGGQK